MSIDRRAFVKSATGFLATSVVGGFDYARLFAADGQPDWAEIAKLYDVTRDITNLENGNWGLMARPVLAEYIAKTEFVNKNNSYYARRSYRDDLKKVTARVASVLGASPEEVVITRNATEALQNLITNYNKLKPGDSVLYADLDYDSMQTAMQWLHTRRGVTVTKFSLPEPATYQGIIEAYDAALRKTPRCKLLLLTHLSHRTGLVVPVREIVQMARSRGVGVIVDAAHSWGQLDFRIRDLDVDFAGMNLHKWMGNPIGAGVMYIRKDRIGDIDPYLGEPGAADAVTTRVHTGTMNMAAVLTVPAALDFHEKIGGANKQARLRSLRNRWVNAVGDHRGIEILTPHDDRMHGGITSFRLVGKTSTADNIAIAKRLAEEHRVFTVHREGPAKGACVRVTPGFYTSEADVDKLITGIRALLA
jgi:isopenicillin-N epimerase